MKIDIDDIKFWMDAIRNSKDRYRTLESFWGGQLQSKTWLVDHLSKLHIMNADIVIFGGWNGVLSALLFNSGLGIKKITSVDIDPACEEIANTMNKRYEMSGKFKAVTADMCTYEYESTPDIIINTSCEHITSAQHKQWFKNIPGGPLVAMQSNNYTELEEHINCSKSLASFKRSSGLKDGVKAFELELPKYTRYLVMGYKK